MKKIQLFTLVSVIVIAVLLTFTKITISTIFTTGGAEYSQIVTEKQALEKDNVVLKEKILTDSSFFLIASNAATLGFTYDNKSRLTFTGPAPFAYRQ